MGNSAFVAPETVRYDLLKSKALPEGGWIEVKADISYGEEQRLYSESVGRVAMGKPEATVSLIEFSLRRMLIWLADWSFGVDITRDAVEALRRPVAKEINAILDRHIESIEGNA